MCLLFCGDRKSASAVSSKVVKGKCWNTVILSTLPENKQSYVLVRPRKRQDLGVSAGLHAKQKHQVSKWTRIFPFRVFRGGDKLSTLFLFYVRSSLEPFFHVYLSRSSTSNFVTSRSLLKVAATHATRK